MKRTRLQRAEAAAAVALPIHCLDSDACRNASPRLHYRDGWLVGHDAGTRDAQRRMARRFKQGLRLSWDKPR